jgi:hypothetical protein
MRKTIEERIAQFAPTELTFNEDLLGDRDRRALRKIVEASLYMDEIFLRQVSPQNPEWLARLESSEAAEDRELLHLFRIMCGPWDRLDEHRPFMGEEAKPLGAGFYPPDLTREEFEGWLAAHPEDEEAFRGYYTAIRRDGDRLTAVPYSEAYAEFLEPAAGLLEEAAEITDNASLARFLISRAAAFRSNEYFQSEMDWLDVEDSLIDVTIGPYEVYEDRLLSYKAAFEAFVGIRDHAESERLEALLDYVPELERSLPGADQYTMAKRGSSSPISVVNQVLCAGETRAGVQTTAFFLPNDEEVRRVKGSKKVMLKNVGEAKFRSCSLPGARRTLVAEQLPMLDFDVFFNLILMHELAHGMGPDAVTLPDGTETTVGRALRDLYPTLEEAKADLAGMCSLFHLIGEGVLSGREEACVCYAWALLRSMGFGIDEAHGRGALVQLNFLLERGGLSSDGAGADFRVHYDEMQDAVRSLTGMVLGLQARGDYDDVQEFLDRYGVLTPPLEAALKRVADLPVDIEPLFPIQKLIESW